MIRSTTFDTKYLVVDKHRYIVCAAYNLKELDDFFHNKNRSEYTIIVRQFDVDKCGMTVKEYDNQGNIIDESFLSYYDYGNAIWEML